MIPIVSGLLPNDGTCLAPSVAISNMRYSTRAIQLDGRAERINAELSGYGTLQARRLTVC